ncbi:hypothetical protein [Dokdonella soli]|uniref:Uncharacterized protein n=1 Tax=Dokdonella soli TaxID=529810 RepID=A0ABN1IXL3_9GAMM
MKRTALLLVALVGVSPLIAPAQEAKPYKDGPVSDVTFIRTKPGKFDDYLKWLAGPWKNLMEAQKKAGLVIGYAILETEPRTPHDANLILRITFANMAALDKTDEADAVAAKVLGSNQQQNQGTIDRESLREILGSQLTRELILK